MEKLNERYKTLPFKTKRIAIKNMNEIKDYFSSRVLDIGIDERSNNGFYVWYILTVS